MQEIVNSARHAAGPPTTGAQARLAPHGLSERALERALSYIHEHLCESFTLTDLARAACISRFHFARLFRASVGSSPMEYVLKARMEAAKQMLVRGDQKIAATAAALGFFDQSHFTRTFRRMTGVSPLAYSRQQLQSGAVEPVPCSARMPAQRGLPSTGMRMASQPDSPLTAPTS